MSCRVNIKGLGARAGVSLRRVHSPAAFMFWEFVEMNTHLASCSLWWMEQRPPKLSLCQSLDLWVSLMQLKGLCGGSCTGSSCWVLQAVLNVVRRVLTGGEGDGAERAPSPWASSPVRPCSDLHGHMLVQSP